MSSTYLTISVSCPMLFVSSETKERSPMDDTQIIIPQVPESLTLTAPEPRKTNRRSVVVCDAVLKSFLTHHHETELFLNNWFSALR